MWRNGNIVGFVSGICERYAHYAEEKNVSLSFEYAESEVMMDFVPDFINRIVQNLLSNALKFTPAGGSVNVSLKRCGEKLKLSVSDTGSGMNESQLEEIFKPFYSGAGKMGTGVGLAVVKLSVEAMGGAVKVDSKVGVGSEFIVTFPVRNNVSEQLVKDESTADEDNECVVDYGLENVDVMEEGAPRILIVEDKPEVARWEMRHLDAGYAFYFAADGVQALQKAEEIVPDLIITDVMMPVMDGLEFCRKVRSAELLSHIPVIMVTAKAEHEDRLRGLEAGADAYLEKPYDDKELLIRVRMLLEQRAILRRKFTENDGSEDLYSAVDKAFLDKFHIALETAFDAGKVDCGDLASELCIGRVQLNRKLKAITGFKTTEYILNVRIAKAKQLLSTTDLSIGEIALKCGIEDVGYFSTIFRKNVGVSPTAYRKG